MRDGKTIFFIDISEVTMTLSLTTRTNTPYTGLINSLPTTQPNTPYTGGLINSSPIYNPNTPIIGLININGDDSNNVLYGNLFDNVMNGKGGNDVMYGDDGNDTMWGGSGSDYITGENGNDFLYGENGDDLIFGGLGSNYIDGGDGNDYIVGGGGNDTLIGGEGYDTISGNLSQGLTIISDFDFNYDIIRVSDNGISQDIVLSGVNLSSSQSPMEFVQEGYAISIASLENGISAITITSALQI